MAPTGYTRLSNAQYGTPRGSRQRGWLGRRRKRGDRVGACLEADLAHAQVADHEPQHVEGEQASQCVRRDGGPDLGRILGEELDEILDGLQHAADSSIGVVGYTPPTKPACGA